MKVRVRGAVVAIHEPCHAAATAIRLRWTRSWDRARSRPRRTPSQTRRRSWSSAADMPPIEAADTLSTHECLTPIGCRSCVPQVVPRALVVFRGGCLTGERRS
jgi:hypothetical protein